MLVYALLKIFDRKLMQCTIIRRFQLSSTQPICKKCIHSYIPNWLLDKIKVYPYAEICFLSTAMTFIAGWHSSTEIEADLPGKVRIFSTPLFLHKCLVLKCNLFPLNIAQLSQGWTFAKIT